MNLALFLSSTDFLLSALVKRFGWRIVTSSLSASMVFETTFGSSKFKAIFSEELECSRIYGRKKNAFDYSRALAVMF